MSSVNNSSGPEWIVILGVGLLLGFLGADRVQLGNQGAAVSQGPVTVLSQQGQTCVVQDNQGRVIYAMGAEQCIPGQVGNATLSSQGGNTTIQRFAPIDGVRAAQESGRGSVQEIPGESAASGASESGLPPIMQDSGSKPGDVGRITEVSTLGDKTVVLTESGMWLDINGHDPASVVGKRAIGDMGTYKLIATD